MALTYVGGVAVAADNPGTGTVDISLTSLTGGSGSSAQEGDIVILSCSLAAVYDMTKTVQSGYTRQAELYANDAYDTNLWLETKIMGSTPDTVISLAKIGELSNSIAGHVMVFRPSTGYSIEVGEVLTATGSNSGRPTPPAITPTVAGSVVVCAGSYALNSTTALTSSTLSNFTSVGNNHNYDLTSGMGSYAWSSGTFTPGQYGGGSTSTSASWAAISMVIYEEFVPIAYSLTATTQSYTLTLINAALKAALKMSATVQTYTLTGIEVTYRLGKSFTAAVGEFTLTGISSNITYARKILGTTQTYVLTGIDNIISKVWKPITAEVQTYALTGINVITSWGRKILTEVASFTLTGIDTIFTKGFNVLANTASYILTGIKTRGLLNGNSTIWGKSTKNTSTFTNQTKNTSSWSNDDKNSSNWNNQNKS